MWMHCLQHLPCRLSVLGCEFKQNSASEYGAGIALGDGTSLEVMQSMFTQNGVTDCPSSQPPVVSTEHRGHGGMRPALLHLLPLPRPQSATCCLLTHPACLYCCGVLP
jgi:hypothetical protein